MPQLLGEHRTDPTGHVGWSTGLVVAGRMHGDRATSASPRTDRPPIRTHRDRSGNSSSLARADFPFDLGSEHIGILLGWLERALGSAGLVTKHARIESLALLAGRGAGC